MKVFKYNISVHAIQENLVLKREEEGESAEGEKQTSQIAIPLKSDNQWSIALAHNPVLHSRRKHIDL